jgi:hypothetical protein
MIRELRIFHKQKHAKNIRRSEMEIGKVFLSMKENFKVSEFQLVKKKFIRVELIKCDQPYKDDEERIYSELIHTWLFLDEELANQFIQDQNGTLADTTYKEESYYSKFWHIFRMEKEEIEYYEKKVLKEAQK